MKYPITILALFILLRMHAQSCMTDNIQYFDFSDIKKTLDQNNCKSCHHQGSQISNWRYDSYELLFKTGSCSYPVVKHGDAASSTLFQVLNGNSKVCFSGFSSDHNLNYLDREKIERWINFGAPEECVSNFEEIKIILDSHQCQSCHNNVAKAGAWFYDDYSDFINDNMQNCPQSQNIVLYNAEQSLLYQKIHPYQFLECGAKMTNGGVFPTDEELRKIRDWINSSAPFNQQSLPVSLEYFKISYAGEDFTEMEWLTESEVNTTEFVIEHSTDGLSFRDIASIPVSGAGAGRYSFSDEHPAVGPNYYRLKINDKDGRHDYSPIRFNYNKSSKILFNLSPNPARSNSEITINWYSKNDNQKSAYLELVDISGKKIIRYFIANGWNKLQLPNLPQGVYLLVLNDYFSSAHWERIVVTDE